MSADVEVELLLTLLASSWEANVANTQFLWSRETTKNGQIED